MDAPAQRRPYVVAGPSAGFVREPEAAEGDWRHAAACLDQDPELFFPIGNTGPALLQVEDAKAVCRRCDVIDQCLQWALESGQDAGVWGGMSEDERRALKRRALKRRAARARAKERGEQVPDEPDAEPESAAGPVAASPPKRVGRDRARDARGAFVSDAVSVKA